MESAPLDRTVLHWRYLQPRPLFSNAAVQRASFFFCSALWQAAVVISPLERLLGRWIPSNRLRHMGTIFVSLHAAAILLLDKQARYHVLRVPFLWWGRYLSKEKAMFSISWYYGTAVIPYVLGIHGWRYGVRSILFKPSSGFWRGLVHWAAELALVVTVRFGWFFVEAALQQPQPPQDIHDGPERQEPSLSREFQTFARRRALITAMVVGQTRPSGLRNYRYKPLNPGEIRLVRLVRGDNPATRIHISIETRNLLRDHPSYTAISYVWGSPDRTHGLVVGDGSWLPTTANTYEILHEQSEWWTGNPERHLFWIDFVCINQDDNVEKEQQVRMMRDIYSRSSDVVAYLRPRDAEEADRAVFFLNSLLSDLKAEKRGRYGLLGIGSRHTLYNTIAGPVMGAVSAVTDLPPSPGWQALSHLLGHAHWTRVWIMQELILAPDTGLRIFYGEREVSWLDLARFATLTPDEFQFVNTDYATIGSEEDMDKSRQRMERTLMRRNTAAHGLPGRDERLPMDLPSLLDASRAMEATDPRDRVWAIQGLLSDLTVLPDNLLPKYDTTKVDELYLSLAQYCISRVDPEWMLCSAGTSQGQQQQQQQHKDTST
ncbi:heterokaryon incompatibility protein-domain-containing protein, partial [Lasiosphaeria ovina]